MFFVLYFLMTGLHAAHMIVGCGVLTVMLCLARKGRFSERYYTPIEITGLYWHFVDIVWVFLYPMFYLIPWR
jgi:cytochrome c oxidase subunit 3